VPFVRFLFRARQRFLLNPLVAWRDRREAAPSSQITSIMSSSGRRRLPRVMAAAAIRHNRLSQVASVCRRHRWYTVLASVDAGLADWRSIRRWKLHLYSIAGHYSRCFRCVHLNWKTIDFAYSVQAGLHSVRTYTLTNKLRSGNFSFIG